MWMDTYRSSSSRNGDGGGNRCRAMYSHSDLTHVIRLMVACSSCVLFIQLNFGGSHFAVCECHQSFYIANVNEITYSSWKLVVVVMVGMFWYKRESERDFLVQSIQNNYFIFCRKFIFLFLILGCVVRGGSCFLR